MVAFLRDCFVLFSDYNSTDVKSFREFYSELLINSTINPLKSTEPLRIEFNELSRKFAEKYGAFKHLLVGGLKQRLETSASFSCQKDDELDVLHCKQTEQGALTSHFWHQQVILYSSNSKAQINMQDEAPQSFPNSKETEQEQRTNQWVLGHSAETSGIPKSPGLNWDEVAPLQKLLPEISLRYSFFLITGNNTPVDDYNGISNIPWLKVFDFNTDSENNGLLSSVKKAWKDKRYFSLATCSTASKTLTNDSTEWLFPLGLSKTESTLFTGTPLAWFNDNKSLLEKQFLDIANFCAIQTVPVFIILWYDPNKNNAQYLNWILSVLYPAFKSDVMSKQIILCTDKASSSDNSILEVVISSYELENTKIDITAENVYKWLARQSVPVQPQQDILRLPKTQGKIVEMHDKVLLLWIQQYIEILPLEPQDKISSRKTKNFGKAFLKGNVISWDELASNSFAVKREGKKKVIEYLHTAVFEKQKSLVLRIQHAPGGGGTTFARQLLWDLHFKLPCGAVVPNLTLSISQISEGVRHLHENTKLPVVLLIDGHSEFEIEQIFENCKYAVVILHVQRYSKKIPQNEFLISSTVYCRLPGLVTADEGRDLTKVFSSFSPQCAGTLKRLTSDVKKMKNRFVFEYGLAAFNHEFKGVRKYVEGYLKLLGQQDGVKYLQPWQRVVAYLSLALYYGQSGVHRETFRRLLQVQNFVTLDHLGYSGSQFIIETKGEWKISYNIVAKEILEQILSGCTSTPTDTCVPELNSQAKANLHELVIDFIEMIQTTSKGTAPETLIQLLTNMIIKRDYSEVDKSDGITKAVHSKLLEDIPNQQNRVKILKKLTEAFPQNAEFHAHLGRLLNIKKEFNAAEDSLQIALEIRTNECLHLGPDFTDDMLSRIHHMFGVGYSLRAQEEQRRVSRVTKNDYQNMLKYVKKAVDHFGEARRHTSHTLSYGCLGEIHVRLLLAQLVEDKFTDGCQRAFHFKLGPEHLQLSEFVRQSHSVCDRLLAECLQYTTEQELQRIRMYTRCVEKFNALYGSINHNLIRQQESNPTIVMQRSQITCLKMNNKTNNRRPCIENVESRKDLQEIITLYESIFRQVFGGSNKQEPVSVDVLEWLEAIRHPLAPDDSSLVKILQVVSNWERKNEPGYATFYLYVINFMLAVFSAGDNLNMQYYKKVLELKEKLQTQRYKCDVAKIQVWRREWIGSNDKDNATSISSLINFKKLGVWDKEKRFWKDEKAIEKLQVFTGSVKQSNQPLKGTIILDVVQSQSKFSIEVYFVPKLYDLDQSRYGEQKERVEFCIGFSCKHGAEAFSVKILKKCFCLYCNKNRECITINAAHNGRCRNCGEMFTQNQEDHH